MEENNQNTMLKWAVGIILTIGVISAGVSSFNKSKPALEKSASQMDTITVQIENSTYNNYKGKVVSGSEVISVINTKASNSLTVTVYTIDNPTTGEEYTSTSYNISDIEDEDYIEPTASFAGAVETTTNGTINEIVFTQTK